MDQVIAFVTSPGMIASYITIAVISAALGFLQRVRNKSMKKRLDKGAADPKQARIVTRVYVSAQYILLTIGIILILQFNGVDVSAMVAAFGVAGIVIGFALQDALSDIIMGIHIMTDNFFRVGDIIRFEDLEGEVILITPQTTKIKSLADGSVTSLSNRKISQATLVSDQNYIDIPLEYEVDMKTAKEVLVQAAALISLSENVEKCEYLGLQAFEDSDVLYRLLICCDPRVRFAVRRMANGIIFEQLIKAGLSIPYTQVEVRGQIKTEGKEPEGSLFSERLGASQMGAGAAVAVKGGTAGE